MKKLISVRLEEEDYKKLLREAKAVGGVGKWITTQLYLFGDCDSVDGHDFKKEELSVLKTKTDAENKVKGLIKEKRIEHSANCKCFTCRPPK